MVKSETRRDAKILFRNPSLKLFGKKFRESKKVRTNHAEMRLRDLSKTLPRFRDPAKIFQDPSFLRYHSPPLLAVCLHTVVCRHSILIDQEERGPLFSKFCYQIIVTIKIAVHQMIVSLLCQRMAEKRIRQTLRDKRDKSFV